MIEKFLPKYFWKRQLLALLVYNFVTSISLFMPVAIPFFTKWGRLNMAQIMTLQSVFLLTTFVAEIPTGVIADKFKRKTSVILSDFSFMSGAVLYSVVASFPIFIIAEILMGIGRAFYSGASEALEYESLKEIGLEGKYLQFVYKKRTAQLLGNILAGVLVFILAKVIFVRYFMALYALLELVGIVIIFTFVKEPKEKERREFVPKYKDILTTALKNFKKHPFLLKLTSASLGIFIASYFQFWLYQKILLKANIAYSYFGIFSIVINLSSLAWASFFPNLYKRFGLKNILMLVLSLGIVFQIGLSLSKSPLFLALVLILLVSLFKESTFLPGKAINDLIKTEVRSTVLSFISLLRSFTVAGLNPIIGLLADKNVYLALISTAVLGFAVVLFSLTGSFNISVNE